MAWRDQRPDRAITLGTEALRLWDRPGGCRTHSAVWPSSRSPPLTSTLGQTEKAVDVARQTLEPTQLWLPDELEAAIQGACEAWDQGRARESRPACRGRGGTGPKASIRLTEAHWYHNR